MPLPTCRVEELVAEAASLVRLDGGEATPLRNGSNAIFKLPGGVVARVAPAGRTATAEREVRIARWFSSEGVRVTQPLADVPQPTVVADRAITWWHTIPPHRAGTPGELGSVLRVVHALEPPDFSLPRYDPFDGIEVRLNQQTVLDPSDRRGEQVIRPVADDVVQLAERLAVQSRRPRAGLDHATERRPTRAAMWPELGGTTTSACL